MPNQQDELNRMVRELPAEQGPSLAERLAAEQARKQAEEAARQRAVQEMQQRNQAMGGMSLWDMIKRGWQGAQPAGAPATAAPLPPPQQLPYDGRPLGEVINPAMPPEPSLEDRIRFQQMQRTAPGVMSVRG